MTNFTWIVHSCAAISALAYFVVHRMLSFSSPGICDFSPHRNHQQSSKNTPAHNAQNKTNKERKTKTQEGSKARVEQLITDLVKNLVVLGVAKSSTRKPNFFTTDFKFQASLGPPRNLLVSGVAKPSTQKPKLFLQTSSSKPPWAPPQKSGGFRGGLARAAHRRSTARSWQSYGS